MKATIPTYQRMRSFWEKLFPFSRVTHPASGWFKPQPVKENRKPRPAGPKILSPDSVHLRAANQKDPLRKNPAP